MQNEYVLEGTRKLLKPMLDSPSGGYPVYPGPSPFGGRRTSPPGSPAPKKCCWDQPEDGKLKEPMYPPTFLCCCYRCPAPRTTSVFASLGICILVIGYTVLGAFVFMALEGGSIHHETTIAASKLPSSKLITDLRQNTVDRLWSITENLNILYRENWTRLAAEEVIEFQEQLVHALRGTPSSGSYIQQGGFDREHRWSFSSSFLYSLTLITTIGYGSVSPQTSWGKLVTIIYALIGIPLMLIYLSTTGELLARAFRKLYGRACGFRSPNGNNGKRSRNDCPCSSTVKVPITLCLIIVLVYICCGAVLFHRLENWSMLEGSYFCFTSLGTIGFGNLIPGQHAEEVSLCVCSIYILAGMALVAMCFSLVQEEASALLRLLGATCSTTRSHHHSEPDDSLSMSVVGS